MYTCGHDYDFMIFYDAKVCVCVCVHVFPSCTVVQVENDTYIAAC